MCYWKYRKKLLVLDSKARPEAVTVVKLLDGNSKVNLTNEAYMYGCYKIKTTFFLRTYCFTHSPKFPRCVGLKKFFLCSLSLSFTSVLVYCAACSVCQSSLENLLKSRGL